MSSRFQIPSSKLPLSGFRFQVSGLRSPVSGFSLIEVIIATAILGLGIAGIVAAGARCLAVARQARNYEIAREAVARVEAEEPIQLEEKLEGASDSGTLERPYENFRWRRDVERVGLDEDALFQVTTVVEWSEGSDKGREEIVTLIRRPSENLPGTAAQ